MRDHVGFIYYQINTLEASYFSSAQYHIIKSVAKFINQRHRDLVANF